MLHRGIQQGTTVLHGGILQGTTVLHGGILQGTTVLHRGILQGTTVLHGGILQGTTVLHGGILGSSNLCNNLPCAHIRLNSIPIPYCVLHAVFSVFWDYSSGHETIFSEKRLSLIRVQTTSMT